MGDDRKETVDVMTLNLHTYQEADQNKKFSQIVEAIQDLTPDLIAFQECAQHKNASIVEKNHSGSIIKADNMALIIKNKLKEKGLNYDYYWDWSHYAWDEWEEGCAVLTRHKMITGRSKYITQEQTTDSWKSRKIVMITVQIPKVGKVNTFSVHTGFWKDEQEPFKLQFKELNEWVEKLEREAKATLLMGDFNIDAGSVGYNYMLEQGELIDLYYTANPDGFHDPTIGGAIDGWKEKGTVDRRIDYIFTRQEEPLVPKGVQLIFTANRYGIVSDHRGIYAQLEID